MDDMVCALAKRGPKYLQRPAGVTLSGTIELKHMEIRTRNRNSHFEISNITRTFLTNSRA